MMGLHFPLWQPEAMTANMSFKGMFTRPGDSLLTTSVATSQSESPVPLTDKSPALEMAKSQDLPSPQPIPEGRRAPMITAFIDFCERFFLCALNASLHIRCVHVLEMCTGWWKVSSSEELNHIVSACHPRGIRERLLQKQIQKHMEFLTQVCAKNKDGKLMTADD